MAIEEHRLININEILVNPENPRHNPVMDLGENFIMQQLVTNIREANAMYKLISDIFKDGWYPQSIITVMYDIQKEKYVAWDGNRRITALKILKNPELADTFKAFNYTQIKGIHNMSKGIKDEDFFKVLCYVSPTFEECAGYIRNIHTNDTGALRWDTASIKRFEEKLGIKNIFTQLQGYCPKAFLNVNKDFPVSKFEKIVSSKIGKEYLKIDFIDYTLTCLTSIEDLEKKVERIIKDINSDVITTDTIKKIKNIKEYLYANEEKNESKLVQDQKTQSAVNTSKKGKQEIEERQVQLFTNKEIEEDEQAKGVNNYLELEKFQNHNVKFIKKDENILFKNINITKLDNQNERSIGIRNLAYEIQKLSISNQFNSFPIAYCCLIRALLEQSSIYFLMNQGIWNKLKQRYNNKDLKLEQIIDYMNKNKGNLLKDTTIRRCWETCFNSEGTKNYLDLVIHHPYKVIANKDAIKSITDIGMFAIIQFFIEAN